MKLAANDSQQTTYTFRSNQGGRFRLITLETTGAFTAQVGYASLSPDRQAIIDFVLSNGAWMIARDNGYGAGFLRYSETQNEAVYKARWR